MKIGVVGLGLIGGSIFKSLQDKHDLVGVSSSVQGENFSKDYSILKDCDLVFVCTPMSATLEVLDRLEKYLTPQTIVTDVCSLKGFVSQKKYSYKFIPSHPMAGTENSGWDSSFAELFNKAKWVITPLGGEIIEEQEILESVIKSLGANIIITTPEEHDKAVALISHMPMVVAQALFLAASENKLALDIAASGFRDMTRLAMSNEEMACDMVNMNAENIEKAILRLYKSLGDLTNKNYAETISLIKSQRQNMFI